MVGFCSSLELATFDYAIAKVKLRVQTCDPLTFQYGVKNNPEHCFDYAIAATKERRNAHFWQLSYVEANNKFRFQGYGPTANFVFLELCTRNVGQFYHR